MCLLITEKELSLCENIKELQTLMSNVGVPDTPTSLECFTTEVASMTLQYIQTSLFQHYSLFQYLYTEEQETEMHTAQVGSFKKNFIVMMYALYVDRC